MLKYRFAIKSKALSLAIQRHQSTASASIIEGLDILENKDIIPCTRAFINNDYVESSSTFDVPEDNMFEVLNPSTLKPITKVHNMGVSDYNKAIDIAHKTFEETRYHITPRDRSQWLYKMYELFNENRLDLAKIITLENGKTLKDSLSEVDYSASYFRWFAEEAPRIYGSIISSSSSLSSLQAAGSTSKEVHARRQPLGVVGILTPWNFPSAMIARKLSVALATGNSCIIKPAKETPLSGLAYGWLAKQADVPAGLVNILPTTYADSIGKLIVGNNLIKKVSFTGSTNIGKLLLKQGMSLDSNDTLKKYSMELGGNAPFIIDQTADLDKALIGLVNAKFRQSGQTCICANRVYVHEDIHDKFAGMLKTYIEGNFKLGDGFDSMVTHGPLIHSKAIDKMAALVQDAKVKGAKILLGGTRASSVGPLFYHPTILTDVDDSMKIFHEEIFGPVCSLIKYSGSLDSVIEECNKSDVGLASYFYSQDVQLIHKVTQQLECGMIGVNSGSISDAALPFGGVKNSGFGREGSLYGIEDYTEVKSVVYEY